MPSSYPFSFLANYIITLISYFFKIYPRCNIILDILCCVCNIIPYIFPTMNFYFQKQTQKAESTLPRIRLLYIHLLFSILYEAVNHRNHTIYTELCHIQAQVIVFCLPPLLSGIVFVIGLSVVICLTHNSLCLSR